MKLPSPIRCMVYKFVVLASDGYQEYEAGGRSSIQIARLIAITKISRQEFEVFQQQLSPVVFDTGKAYPSTYSLESVESIKNLAQVLPEADSTELQRIFWKNSVLSIFMFNSWFRPLFQRAVATPQEIFHGDFKSRFVAQNVDRIARNIWSNSKRSSIRNLVIDLKTLASRATLPLKRILRLHLELDSLSLIVDYNNGICLPLMDRNTHVPDLLRENVHLLSRWLYTRLLSLCFT